MTHRRRMAALVCLALIAAGSAPPRAAAAQQRPAPRVQPAEAPALPASDRASQLLGSPADARPLQQEARRYTRRGLVVGAILGGLGGLGFGTLLGLLCATEGDSCWWVIPATGLVGAAGGAAVGAIIGAAVPRAAEDTPARVDTVRVPAPLPAPRVVEEDHTGSFGIAVGRSNATVHGASEVFEGTGTALRANVYAELLPWFAIGPEAGQVWLGEGGEIRHAALALRGTWPLGVVSPYVAGNMGVYQTTGPSLEFLGGGIGAGARVTPFTGRRVYLDAEARWSRNTHNIDPMRVTTLSVGGGLYW